MRWRSDPVRFTSVLLPTMRRHLQRRPGSFLLRLIMLVFTRPRSPLRAPPPPVPNHRQDTAERLTEEGKSGEWVCVKTLRASVVSPQTFIVMLLSFLQAKTIICVLINVEKKVLKLEFSPRFPIEMYWTAHSWLEIKSQDWKMGVISSFKLQFDL